MNFQDFYKDTSQLRFSFEIFPPKNEAGVRELLSNLKELSEFNPAFISVTYGAMGSTRDLTRDLAIRIHNELELTAAFHFTCVGTGRKDIKEYVEHLKNEGLDLVVALRGDPPKGDPKFVKPKDGFSYANELVEFLRKIDHFSIAVAGYPEGHIEAPDKEVDLKNLKRKVNAGADIVITQLFYDNKDYYDFVKRAQAIGIDVPIIPGIMPILHVKQIEKIAGMCGARLPDELHKKLFQNNNDPDKMRDIGINYAIDQCKDLIKNGAPGIHFYILNKTYSVRKILENIEKC